MITWVLAEEPTEQVGAIIEILEARVGSEGEVMWVSPGPIVETIPE